VEIFCKAKFFLQWSVKVLEFGVPREVRGWVGWVIVVKRTFPELVWRSVQNLAEIGPEVCTWKRDIGSNSLLCIYTTQLGPGAAQKKINEIKSPIWTFFVKQSFFSSDLLRFWSLVYPRVRGWVGRVIVVKNPSLS